MPGIYITGGVKAAVAIPGFYTFWRVTVYKITHKKEQCTCQQTGIAKCAMQQCCHERHLMLLKDTKKRADLYYRVSPVSYN
jgi:hypothetical protein